MHELHRARGLGRHLADLRGAEPLLLPGGGRAEPLPAQWSDVYTHHRWALDILLSIKIISDLVSNFTEL